VATNQRPDDRGLNVFDPWFGDVTLHLYALLITPSEDARIIFSGNGGSTWRRDRELDRLMRGNSTFRYQTRQGPTPVTTFLGYRQPTLLAFDPEDPGLLVAGGHDSGVFLSRDGGENWWLVTDPSEPMDSNIPHLTRPRFAYFDHDVPPIRSIFTSEVAAEAHGTRQSPRISDTQGRSRGESSKRGNSAAIAVRGSEGTHDGGPFGERSAP
jgi:hypothetical protein